MTAAGTPRWSGQADGLHELPLAAAHRPPWARFKVITATEMQEAMEKVIGQFMLWSPVVSRRLADRSFTAGNDFAGHSQPGRSKPPRSVSCAEIEADDIGWPGNAEPALVKLGNFGIVDNHNAEICLRSPKLSQSRGEQPPEVSLPRREPALAVATGNLPADRSWWPDHCRPCPVGTTPHRYHYAVLWSGYFTRP